MKPSLKTWDRNILRKIYSYGPIKDQNGRRNNNNDEVKFGV